jgi:glutaredoxin
VANSKEGREEMVRKSGRMSVPTVEIDGEIVVGFDETLLKNKLGV